MGRVLRANAGLLAAGLLAFALMGVIQALYGPALPALARGFGLTTPEAGLLVSAHWMGGAAGILAMLAAPRRVPPVAALAATAAGAGAVAAGVVWPLSLAGAALLGLGGAVLSTTYNRRFMAEFGARGPAMLSLLNALFGFGAICGPLIYVGLGGAPGPAFAVVAGLALLLVPLALATARPAAAAAPAAGEAAPPAFAPRWGILGFGMLGIALEATLIGLGPTALVARGIAEARAAELQSLFFVAFLGARLALVGLAALLPAFTLFAAALAGLGIAALALALTGLPALYPLLGLFVGAFFPMFFVAGTRLMGTHPRAAPTIMGAGLAGGILGPLAAAQAMALLGDARLFALVAGVALAGGLAALVRLRGMNGAGLPAQA